MTKEVKDGSLFIRKCDQLTRASSIVHMHIVPVEWSFCPWSSSITVIRSRLLSTGTKDSLYLLQCNLHPIVYAQGQGLHVTHLSIAVSLSLPLCSTVCNYTVDETIDKQFILHRTACNHWKAPVQWCLVYIQEKRKTLWTTISMHLSSLHVHKYQWWRMRAQIRTLLFSYCVSEIVS